MALILSIVFSMYVGAIAAWADRKVFEKKSTFIIGTIAAFPLTFAVFNYLSK